MRVNGFEIVDLRNYLLSLEEVQRLGDRTRQNRVYFGFDFNTGKLDRYRGDFVVYRNGQRCGHCDGEGETGIRLLDAAISLYGNRERITVFKVPNNGDLEQAICNAFRSDNKV